MMKGNNFGVGPVEEKRGGAADADVGDESQGRMVQTRQPTRPFRRGSSPPASESFRSRAQDLRAG